MTTKSDWEFRARHLEEQARYLDSRAEQLREEARNLRLASKMAEANAKFWDFALDIGR